MPVKQPLELTISSWNIRHDVINQSPDLGAQQDRMTGIASVLEAHQQAHQRPFDIIGLYEVHGTVDTTVLGRLGLSQYDFVPNGRHNSGILLAGGDQVLSFEQVVLDEEEERRALIAYCVGGVAIAAMHPSHYPFKGGYLRKRQTKKLLGIRKLTDCKQVIIMGDFNDTPGRPPRRMLEDHGFTSVFQTSKMRRPKTFPSIPRICDTGHTTPALIRPMIRGVLGAIGLPLDDVYVKGDHSVTHASILKAVVTENGQRRILSDHHGIATTIALQTA